MKSNSATSLCIALLAAFIILRLSSFILAQGSLTPPPGAPAPTMKTLSQVQPRTVINPTNTPGDTTATYIIGAPGCFYLTGDVVGVAGKDGIKVTANGPVTIDLNGFALRGIAGSGHGVNITNGIQVVGLCSGGTIEGWGGDGVRISGTGAMRLHDLSIANNQGAGLRATSTSGTALDIAGVVIASNAGDGVELGGGGNLRNVTIKNNGAAGVKILASAMGVGLDHVSIAGSGTLISDAGTGTNFGPTDSCSITGTGSSAVVLGPNATVHGMTLNVTGDTLSGPVVDASAADISIGGLTIKATGVTADSLLRCGNGLVSENGGPVGIVATNCSLTTTIVNVIGDNVTLGGMTLKPSGTTTAPTAIRVQGNRCHLALLGIGLTAGVPIGIDCVQADTTAESIIMGVVAGGTGIRISGGGHTVSHCRVSGDGTGAITGVALLAGSSNNLVVNNEFAKLTGGTGVSNLGLASNTIGPMVTNANLGAATNPFANIQH